MLKDDGTVNMDNLRKARSTDSYIMKGTGEESWEPRFTYHGFRYVQVEGWPGKMDIDSIGIRVVRSAVEPSGTFACSNELLNRIHRMVTWTEASNLHSVPTDCPQRDERMGWLNDMTVRIEPALYNFRLARLYAKFLDDVADTQSPDGAITDTAPFKWGKRPADPVSASYLLLGWLPYLHYGDTEPMRAHYAGFARWVDYLVSRSERGILSYSSWGDWAPPQNEAISGSIGAGAVSAKTPGELISTGYLHYHAKLLAQMARVLGDESEAARREQLAQEVAQAFNEKFWDEKVGGYGSNNQACNAFALFLGVVSPERVPRVVHNLVQAVEKNGYHLSTGNLCTKYLLEMLTEQGHSDVALRIATQTTYPSWGFMLENGATTTWERWEYLTGGAMNSHNHPMLGSVGSWFYKYLAGILPDAAGPGFSRFIIQPRFLDGLEWVEGSYHVLPGVIRSAWRKVGRQVVMTISVPANTVATLHFPVASPAAVTERGVALSAVPGVTLMPSDTHVVVELGSGDYEFTVNNGTEQAGAPRSETRERDLLAITR
jgi:alpha-L-rhamnosidase